MNSQLLLDYGNFRSMGHLGNPFISPLFGRQYLLLVTLRMHECSLLADTVKALFYAPQLVGRLEAASATPSESIVEMWVSSSLKVSLKLWLNPKTKITVSDRAGLGLTAERMKDYRWLKPDPVGQLEYWNRLRTITSRIHVFWLRPSKRCRFYEIMPAAFEIETF